MFPRPTPFGRRSPLDPFVVGRTGRSGLVRLPGFAPATTPRSAARQEVDFMDGFFDGTVASDLEGARNRTRTNITNAVTNRSTRSQNLLDRLIGQLAGQRQSYKSDATNLMSGFESALKSGREGYASKAQSGIDSDAAAAAAQLAEFEQAEKAAADQAVSSAFRANKAMFAKTGMGGGSYAQRLGAGIKVKAATDLAQRIAERKLQNRLDQRRQQSALDAALADRERTDLSSLYGDRSRLLDALAGHERGDTSFIYGQQSGIYDRDATDMINLERELAGMDRDDLRYLLSSRMGLMGRRSPLLRALEDDEHLVNPRGHTPVYF